MSGPDSVSLVPLGGLGEFGMNMMLVRCGDDMIVVDAGMALPDSNLLGVDFVLPDVSYLLEQRDDVRAVILTHGHEDHIGGLAHLLQHVNVPVYGTDLTLALAKNRLREYGALADADLNEIDVDAELNFGNIRCEFLQVAHSFPNSLSVVMRTPVGTILHTSDFKLDHTPVGSDSFDVGGFAALGNEGVLALLSDSTNVEVPGFAPSERSLRPELERIFHGARGRLIVSTFASSLHRVQQLIDLAAQFGRSVAVTGRSMINNTRVASELDYLWFPSNLMVDIRDVQDMPPEEVMVMTTGSQGEPLSALSLMANDSHAHLRIEEGDTVLISARVIPGHEKEITNVVNHLYRRGADVYYGHRGIHASGHGFQEDLKMMLSLVRPEFFIPVHGEYRQLTLHARLAQEMGVPTDHVCVIENGQRAKLTRDRCEVVETAPAGRVLVDGRMLDNLDEIVLRDRRQLSEDGMVLVVVALSRQTGDVEAGPDIISRGFIYVDESEELVEEAKQVALAAVKSLNREERSEQETVQETVRLALRRFFTKNTDRRPIILPVIIEV